MQNGKDLSITQDETSSISMSIEFEYISDFWPSQFECVYLQSRFYFWFYYLSPCSHLVNASQLSTWLHLGDVASLCIGRSSALTFMVSHDGISMSWAHSVQSQGLKINSILWFLVHVFSWMSEISSDLFRLRGPSSTCIIFTRCILCGELCGTESAATPWAGLYFDWRLRLLRVPFDAFCKFGKS